MRSGAPLKQKSLACFDSALVHAAASAFADVALNQLFKIVHSTPSVSIKLERYSLTA